MKAKRPFLLWLLMVIFSTAALISLFGVIGTLRQWEWFSPYLPVTSLAYIVFRGLFLALAGFFAAWILFRRCYWAVHYCRIFTIIAVIWLWFERIILTRNPLPFNQQLLPMIFTFLVLSLMLYSLYFLVPFFDTAHHRTINQESIQHTTGEINDQTSS